MKEKSESRLHLLSAERDQDKQFIDEVNLLNQEEIMMHKRISDENKLLCKTFWNEQMALKKRHKRLRDFM